jgi:hypothetical protein
MALWANMPNFTSPAELCSWVLGYVVGLVWMDQRFWLVCGCADAFATHLCTHSVMLVVFCFGGGPPKPSDRKTGAALANGC